MALAQALLLPNWFAGLAGLACFGFLFFSRVGPEERMMEEAFGDEYRAYVAQILGLARYPDPQGAANRIMDLETKIALDFLKAYPTPQALVRLTRRRWSRFAMRDHHLSEGRANELWEKLGQPQLPIPEHVVRAKATLLLALVVQLEASVKAVDSYRKEVDDFFAAMPAAEIFKTLPGAKSGTTMPALWAELGDADNRWQSFRHLQCEAGAVPVTQSSGKSSLVVFRFACNKHLRHAVYWFAFNSLKRSEWANKYYRNQRAKGSGHHRALRALGAKWLKIIFVMWRDHKPYDENYHLANMARHAMRQAA